MKGNISISKVTVCREPRKEDYMSIRVDDESSGIQFLEVKMSLVDFTQALTGLSYMPVEFELRGLGNIGKKCEYKTMEITIPRDPDTLTIEDKDIDKAVGEHEVDGWMGDRKDCRNHHNFVKTFKKGGIDFWVHNVHFWRYVDVAKEEQDA